MKTAAAGLAVFFLAGCGQGTAPPRFFPDSVAFYHGEAQHLSPHGEQVVGRAKILVKRQVNPGRGEIVEDALYLPLRRGAVPERIVAVMRRAGAAKRFSATGPGFSGEMAFDGPEWAFDRWTYALALKDGGVLEGEGSLDAEGIKTRKAMRNVEGIRTLIIKEELPAVDAEEYARRLKEFDPPYPR